MRINHINYDDDSFCDSLRGAIERVVVVVAKSIVWVVVRVVAPIASYFGRTFCAPIYFEHQIGLLNAFIAPAFISSATASKITCFASSSKEKFEAGMLAGLKNLKVR
jgi:hypothetical protein